jgi:hypothetical protein
MPRADVVDVPLAGSADQPSCAFPNCAQTVTLRCDVCGRLCCGTHVEVDDTVRCHDCLASWRERRWEVILNALPGLLGAVVAGGIAGVLLTSAAGLEATVGFPLGGGVAALLWFVHKGGALMAQTEVALIDVERRRRARHLNKVACRWLLVAVGGSVLVPSTVVPSGIWEVGVGLIMLGLCAARQVNGIRPGLFSIGAGVVALGLGLASLAGL